MEFIEITGLTIDEVLIEATIMLETTINNIEYEILEQKRKSIKIKARKMDNKIPHEDNNLQTNINCMTVEEMLAELDKAKDSPFYEIYGLLDKNNFQQATKVIKDYFKCDENTAKIVCMDFKTKVYDELMKPDPNLTPQEIAHNQAVAREWSNKPKCQICGSTNIKRITTTAKVVNVAMFGILGNKRKHQWHCNNCKSDF